MQVVRDGVALDYDVTGPDTGAPVVFANALGTTRAIWDQVLAHLPAGLRIIRYDMRGHGASDAPDGPYTMGQLVSDAEAVCDATGARDAMFIGLSVGGMVAQGLAVKRPDLIRALHFPDNADDAAGFTALRRALRDHGARRLVQASQDVLTLLAQDGIYMDDLRPDPANADLWRRFAQGVRGQSLDQLGAVRDPAVLALVGARMRQDTIFRDAVHHFLRLFDEFLVRFEQPATDTELLKLAETRTARAFMLLGRASRTFD
jgi:pimeloyl-ACP methyl ester carboxylesterase